MQYFSFCWNSWQLAWFVTQAEGMTAPRCNQPDAALPARRGKETTRKAWRVLLAWFQNSTQQRDWMQDWAQIPGLNFSDVLGILKNTSKAFSLSSQHCKDPTCKDAIRNPVADFGLFSHHPFKKLFSHKRHSQTLLNSHSDSGVGHIWTPWKHF